MRLVFIVILLFTSHAAIAQERLVRSGTHSNFVRLAIPVVRGEAWRFGRVPDGYALEMASANALNLSDVYDLIGRDRISDVRVAGDRLQLDIACECHAEASYFKDRFVVVDVIDGPPPAASLFETPLNGAESVAPRSASIGGPQMMRLPLAPGVPAVAVANTLAVPRQEISRPELNDIDELERGVIDSLARAATEGLVQLAEEPDGYVERESETEQDLPLRPPVEVTSVRQELPAGRDEPRGAGSTTPGIRYRTSFDELRRLSSGQPDDQADGSECWPPALTDFESASESDIDFATTIAELRADVSDDRDQPDAASVEALAKGYLFFGFGEEALQALAIDSVNDRSRRALRAMAEVIDGLPQSQADLMTQTSCSGSTALWAALASEEPTLPEGIDVGQIVRQFKLLPLPLQTHLGPRLAESLNRSGHVEAGETLLVPAVEMAQPPVAAEIASSELASSRGQITEATKTLETLADGSARITPEALVRLVDLQIEADDIVTDEHLGLLETFAFEFRKQDVAADIKRARVSALVSRSELRAAADLLDDDEPSLPTPTKVALDEEIMAGAVKNPDDMLFLDFAFSNRIEESSSDLQNAVASRLLDLGFPDRATDILEPSTAGEAMAERRYLRATAAMALGNLAEAGVILSEISTPRATAILSGSVEPGADGGLSSTEAAFRTEDWSALTASDDPLLQDTANLVQAQIDPTPDALAPLASGRAMIEDAGQTRSTLDNLVNRFELPADE